jgi:hypothetical protein
MLQVIARVLRVFMEGGFVMWVLALIVLVLLGLVLRTLWELVFRGGTNTTLVQSGLDGLLFWGGFAVIIGVLGSAAGYHKSLSAMAAHGVANPRFIWMGAAEGLVSGVAGLSVLMVAGICWYILRWKFLDNRRTAR